MPRTFSESRVPPESRQPPAAEQEHEAPRAGRPVDSDGTRRPLARQEITRVLGCRRIRWTARRLRTGMVMAETDGMIRESGPIPWSRASEIRRLCTPTRRVMSRLECVQGARQGSLLLGRQFGECQAAVVALLAIALADRASSPEQAPDNPGGQLQRPERKREFQGAGGPGLQGLDVLDADAGSTEIDDPHVVAVKHPRAEVPRDDDSRYPPAVRHRSHSLCPLLVLVKTDVPRALAVNAFT